MPVKNLGVSVFLACVFGAGCETAPEPKAPAASAGRPACSSTVVTMVTAAKPILQVSYVEPSSATDGRPLTRLAKTTIYYDIGQGPVRAKDVPASKPTGGGQVSEVITIPVEDANEVVVRICVTATDDQGNEGPPTP